MAIINSITGYYGFTLDGTEGSSPVDRKGQVDRCIIAIIYPPYKNDVTVTISDGPDDWGIKMGDDSIIPLRNPKILFTNRDNCIAQFDMDTLYPSNSPCSLVYRSETAKITMKEESSSSGEFKVNSVSGHFAFTTNSFGANTNTDGEVDKLLATIPFPYQISTVRVTISNGAGDWGARMGDGSIIPISNPEVIRTNSENAIVKFDMSRFYPSNSPCILVYMSENASIGIEEIDDDLEFHPATNIIDVPSNAIAGEVIDLNTAKVLPWNASVQKIDWTVVSGTGVIRDKHYLVTNKQGVITIRGTIENGMEGDDSVNDFVKTFNVTVSRNVITIDANPAADVRAYVGKIDEEISVVAKSVSDHIKYQWYKCNSRNYAAAVKLEGSTQSIFKVPTSLTKGEYFYYCELTSDGADTVKSTCCRVYVDHEITSIRIVPRTDVLPFTGTRDLNIEHSPAEADSPRIVWRSSDSDKVNVDVDGNVTANLLPGTITITAETVDGKHRDTLDLTINDFVSVNDIVSVMNSGDTQTNYTLTGSVRPANASYRTITWSIIDAGGTGASINNGVLHAVNPGIVKVKATIEKGLTFNSAYTKEFFITINKKFVPVTDITVNCDTTKEYLLTDKLSILHRVVPHDSTNTEAVYSIISGPGLLNDNTLSFNGGGDVIIGITIKNGGNNGDFSKRFTIKCSGKEADKELIESYIPVTKVSIEFPHTLEDGSIVKNEYFDPFEEGNNPMLLPYSVIPEFATNKKVTASISRIISRIKPIGIVNGIETVVPDDFWDGDEWEEEDRDVIVYDNSSNEITCNINKLKVSRFYQITIHVIVSNGRNKTEEFIDDVIIKLSSENRLPWIPLEDLEINCPSKMRVYYPILATDFNFIPINSDIKFDPDRNNKMLLIPSIPENEDDVGALIFDPKTYDLYHTIPPLPIFDWSRNCSYMYPYNPGVLKLRVMFADATVDDVDNYDKYYPTKIEFDKEFTFDILPPFVPVSDIGNIPNTIYSGSKIILSPDVLTNDGLSCYNPCWDEEEATNSDVVWSIVSGPGGVSITNDGVLSVPNNITEGSLVIKAQIAEGVSEYLEWYDKTQQAVDYIKTFNITIIPRSNVLDVPVCKLGTRDGKKFDVTLGNLSTICNNKPSSYIVNNNYKKSDIVSITFLDSILKNRNDDNPVNIDNIPDKIATHNDKVSNVITLITDYSLDEISWYRYDDNGNPFNVTDSIGMLISGRNVNGKITNGLCTIINLGSKDDLPDHINIGYGENENSPIKVVRIYTNPPSSLSLKNFAMNFINLTTLSGSIPEIVNGSECMENFLRGCINFNQIFSIPNGISGTNCMKYFMRGCKMFNKTLNIPSSISGIGCLHGFLYGATSFNQPINIPSGVTGASCLERFLYGATSFNQPINIPSGVTGRACMRQFLGRCTSFNQPITLPSDVGLFVDENGMNNGRQFNSMLECVDAMCSTITVPLATATHAEVSERTFSTYNHDSPLINFGILIDGPGAEVFSKKLVNSYDEDENGYKPYPPYSHIRNLD